MSDRDDRLIDGQSHSNLSLTQITTDKRRFRMSDGFYGRTKEMQTLREVFARVQGGAVEIVTVSGPAGSGKTRLIQEFYREISHRNAFVVAGKCEQFQRNIPYAPLITALQEVIRQILTERSERLAVWKDRINNALGANAPLMEELIPCLTWLVGPHLQTESLAPKEAQNRFINVFKDFLGALADSSHPLVIFLDDLQWVDAVTLQIFDYLVVEQQSKYLLLIGSYRDQEVKDDHPVVTGLTGLKESGFKITELYLQLFNVTQITEILAETLHQSEENVKPLAKICHHKTLGNPFFLNRFCYELDRRRLICYQESQGNWMWQLDKIRSLASSDNVIDLLVANLGRLSQKLCRVAQVAACIGNHFQVCFLAAVLGSSVAVTERCLTELMREELIRRLTPDEPENEVGQRQYQFVHDRVQQAADSLLEEKERKLIHQQIGRLLLVASPAPKQDDKLFSIVYHMNYALDLVTESGERLLLAKLNLEAAQKAQAGVAYREADQYLAKARVLLGTDCWEKNYDLAYQVYRHQAEITLLGGRFEESEKLLRHLLDRVHSDLDRVTVYNLLIQQYTMENKMAAALQMGRAALHLLGVELPEHCTDNEVEQELTELRKMVGDGGLLNRELMPVTAQPREIVAYQIMVQLISPLMFLDRQLLVHVQILNVRNALAGAFCPEATVFFAGLGTSLCNLYREYDLGYQLNQFAMDMALQLHAPAWQCVVSSSLANYCGWSVKPLRELEAVNTEGYLAGLEAGKADFVGLNMAHIVCNAFYMGQALPSVSAKIDEFLPYAVKTQHTIAREVLQGFKFLIANLTGRTADRFTWDYEGASEADYLKTCRTAYAVFYSYLFKAEVMYLYGKLPEAGELIGKARAVRMTVLGLFANVELAFYEALILIGLERENPETADRDRVIADLDQLRHWADHCPANFEHKYALVSAEVARLNGDFGKAVDAFDHAVHQARSNGFTQDEALASELAAGFWKSFGKTDFVRLYLRQADQAYQRWGAVFKRTTLVEQYPEIPGTGGQSVDWRGAGSMPMTPAEINWQAVQQVGEALISEGPPTDLFRNMLTVAMEYSGFSQGCLAVKEGESLQVLACGRLDPLTRQSKITLQTMDVELARDWSPGIIRYVARTQEEVVLPGTAAGFVTRDEYLRRRQPQSLVALPLLYRGCARGVMYLEEHLTQVKLTQERLDLLRVLAAQAAGIIVNYPPEVEPTLDGQTPESTVTANLSSAMTQSAIEHKPSIFDRQLFRGRFELLFYYNNLPQKQELYSFVGFREGLPRMLITCFGGFDLFVLTHTVIKVKWRTLKARELMASLVDNRGTPVAKEKLICQLWPDLPPQRAKDLFRTTLYYCRKALQEYDLGELIRNDQTGYSLDLTEISCDALLFRQGLEECNRIDTKEKAIQVEELVALYRGAYLDESQWEWAEPVRTHYQQMVVTAITKLVQYYRHTGNLEKLTLYLERLLEFDPYSSEANEALIRGYAKKGRISEAKRYYEMYSRLLRNDLGLQPEKTLQEILTA